MELFSGLTYSPSDIVNEDGTFVLRSSNVKNGEVIDADNVYVNSDVANSSNVKKGDIIVVVRNGSRSLIGKHAQIKNNKDFTVIGAFMTGLRSEHSNFINALLDTPMFKAEIDKNLGATINQITNGMFHQMQFMIPKAKEQDRIGEVFTELDNLITLHQRKYDKLKIVKKSMLEKMFPKEGCSVPEIRFAGFTEAWEQRKLDDFGKSTGGTSIESEFSKEGKYKVISIGSYSENSRYNDQGIRASLTSKTESRVLNQGDLTMILNDKTATGRIIGRVLLIENSGTYVYNQRTERIEINNEYYDSNYLFQMLNAPLIRDRIVKQCQGNTQIYVNWSMIKETKYLVPKLKEQKRIGAYFDELDNLITLHQRKLNLRNGGLDMLDAIKKTDLFPEYYSLWIKVYKEGAVQKITMNKYYLTERWLLKLVPNLQIYQLNRMNYQKLLNDYAKSHEKQTTMDFHHQLKASIMDAVDEGLIDRNPTRKVVIKGKIPREKKPKYLSYFELQTLLADLDLKPFVSWDWLILLLAKTGLRFSEGLALTPNDFDFSHQSLAVNKTWDYKNNSGFLPTKNQSSVRKIQIDWQTITQFSELIRNLPPDKPIFIWKKQVYNSTVNDILTRHCKAANIPSISIHGLRHTHASILLFAGVSIASVAHRLGHSNITTTQKTYLHIIQELENKDVDLIMRSLSGLLN